MGIDEAIMRGVNGGVRMYNSVTGGTKYELSNILTLGGCSGLVLGAYQYHPILGASAGIASTGIGVPQIINNNCLENKEISAIENGLMDPYVENEKIWQKYLDLLFWDWFDIGGFWVEEGVR